MNNQYASIISIVTFGVSQGSILGVLLLNIFLNNFFSFITIASVHNNAYDNILSASSTDVELLSQEFSTMIDRLIPNYMVADPKKSKVIVITKGIYEIILIT